MDNLTLISKATSTKRKSLTNWFAKQSDEYILKIFKVKRNEFFKLKQTHFNLLDEELDYLALIAAINYKKEQEETLNKKNKCLSLKELSKVDFSHFKVNKKSEKKDAIINRFSIIENFRKMGMSWRTISNIFKTKYRVNVSHSYIRDIYEKVSHD